MIKRIRILAWLSGILFYTNSIAQTEGLGSWSVINIRYAFHKNWTVWSEVQTRSNRFYDHFFYHEIKGGLQFNFSKGANFVLGTGRYRTYTAGGSFKSPITADEVRLWEQFTLTNNLSRLKLEHRYRIEQRWFTTGFRNRFRYRISLAIPLGSPKLQPHTVFATAFNEVFITDTKPHFERNRSFVGIGYQFSKLITAQTGYCNQYDYQANGSSVTNHFLQTTLFFNFKRKDDNEREYHPTTVD